MAVTRNKNSTWSFIHEFGFYFGCPNVPMLFGLLGHRNARLAAAAVCLLSEYSHGVR
jgi:hypothetical protein